MNFHGEKRCNEENRHGLLVDFRIAEANGRAEREVALTSIEETWARDQAPHVGADKGYDTRGLVDDCRDRR